MDNQAKDIIDRILDTKFNMGPIDYSASIIDQGFSSLRLVELIYELESHFGTSIDEAQISDIKTMDDLALLFTNI